MNGAMIVYILGQVLRIEGLLMLPSFFVGLIYGEQQGWAYLVMGAGCLVVGTLIASINRDGQILIPSGVDTIEVRDTVMVVTTHSGFNDIRDILA